MLKSVTWQQVALTAILVGSTVVVYKYLGETAAAAMVSITTIVTFMLGRPHESPKDGSQ